ncbi:MAG: EsaB/YukD family protein [Janthinobacterium lividum]
MSTATPYGPLSPLGAFREDHQPQENAWVDVRVVGPAGHIDVALPVDRPTAEIVGDLTGELLPGAPLPVPPRGWRLHRLGHEEFSPDATLRSVELSDGEVLHVSPGELPRPAHVIDDTIVALGDGAATVGLWTRMSASHALSVAALIIFVGAGFLAWASGRGPAVPLLVATGCMLAAGVLHRTPGATSQGTSATAALAALPSWALSGFSLADWLNGGGVAHVAATAAGVAVGSAAVAACAPHRAAWWMASGVMGATIALGCVLPLHGLDLTASAAVLATVLLVVTATLPWIVTRTPPWISAASERSEAELHEQALRTRRLLGAATDGCVLVTGACAVVLALDGSALAVGVAAALGVVVLLRSRHTVFALDAATALVAGGAVLGTVAVVLLLGAGTGGRLGVLLALVMAGAVALVLQDHLVGDRRSSVLLDRLRGPRLRRTLGVVETLAAVAILPLLAGLLGVYDFAADAGARI